jgi:Mor family transcriptional regulator
MIKMEFLQQAVENFPEYVMYPYNIFMTKNGFEAICEFSRVVGGSNMYIPSEKTIFAQCIEQEILKRYNGKTNRELILLSGYSSSRFYYFINKHLPKN